MAFHNYFYLKSRKQIKNRISVLFSFIFLTSIIFISSSQVNFKTVTTNTNSSQIPLNSGALSWWNDGFLYRRNISIQNYNDYEIEKGSTYTIKINTYSLISDGKLLKDGWDLRVIWRNSSSMLYSEIDRYNSSNFNSENTFISFNIQENIPKQIENKDYFLYYGINNAIDKDENEEFKDPLSNPYNIFSDYENFDYSTSEKMNWTITSGEGWLFESDTCINKGKDLEYILFNNLEAADVSIEVKIKSSSEDFGLGLITRYINVNKFYYAGLGFLNWKTNFGRETSQGLINVISDGFPEKDLKPDEWYNLRFDCIGNNFRVYVDNSIILNIEHVDITQYGPIGLVTLGDSISVFDEFRIMKPMLSLPKYSLLIEENLIIPSVLIIESADPLELGDKFLIEVYIDEKSSVSECLLIVKETKYVMINGENNYWYYNDWNLELSAIYDYSIQVIYEDKSELIIDGTVTVKDTSVPAPPEIIEAPTGNISDDSPILIFDWNDGIDESGIDSYRLIIDNESDIYNTTGFLYDILIINTGENSSSFELELDLEPGIYYYYLYQIDDANLVSSATYGSFQVIAATIIEPPPNPSPGGTTIPVDIPSPYNPLYFYIIGVIALFSITIVGYSKMKGSNFQKNTTTSDLLEVNNQPSNIAIYKKSMLNHLNKIDIVGLFSHNPPDNTILSNSERSQNIYRIDKISDFKIQYNILRQIEPIIQDAEQIFKDGAYFEAIINYRMASEFLKKKEYASASKFYFNKAKHIENVLKQRNECMNAYNEFSQRNFSNQFTEQEKAVHLQKIHVIIELSEQLYDTDTVKKYKEIIRTINSNLNK